MEERSLLLLDNYILLVKQQQMTMLKILWLDIIWEFISKLLLQLWNILDYGHLMIIRIFKTVKWIED